MNKKLSVDELLEKAKKPAKLAMAYHPFYGGLIKKISVIFKSAQNFIG